MRLASPGGRAGRNSLPVSVARGSRPVLALGRAEGARPLQLQQRRQHPRRGDEVRGHHFDAAKLRAAELLGRSDLIKQTGGHQRFQAMDATNLLRPAPDQRDEGLPVAYLAHRLGVAVEQVPRPTTPMTGFKSLAYFDPPATGSRAKPKLVGNHPCAVFGTLAADGRRHAHRIYVAPAGAGKAELGNGPNGRPRDPKKSAKVTGEQSTAGCAVLWGDPTKAPHLLLTEGIETGAAVALVFLPEIEQGQVAVAAAITAGGVEAFQPWPATKRVTVAADRDEGAKAGWATGLTAWRAGGEDVWVAPAAIGSRSTSRLPGVPDESVDWLDVLLPRRAEAVREGLLAAEPFVASSGRARGGQGEARAARQARGDSPYLSLAGNGHARASIRASRLRAGPRSTSWSCWNKDPETGREGAGAGTCRRLRSGCQHGCAWPKTGEAFGLRVMVEDMAGQPRAVDFDRADLARLGAADTRSRLFAAGLRTEGDGEVTVVQALKAADPQQEIMILRRPGWHRLIPGAAPLFVTPSGEVIGAGRGHQGRAAGQRSTGAGFGLRGRACRLAGRGHGSSCMPPTARIGRSASSPASPGRWWTWWSSTAAASTCPGRPAAARRQHSASPPPPGRRRSSVQAACSARCGCRRTPSRPGPSRPTAPCWCSTT